MRKKSYYTVHPFHEIYLVFFFNVSSVLPL